jgi:hypothetical protein
MHIPAGDAAMRPDVSTQRDSASQGELCIVKMGWILIASSDPLSSSRTAISTSICPKPIAHSRMYQMLWTHP